ncbi:MAG: Nitrogen assimilation regulatory protein [Syntrophorhabdaceae bacterium PtaU1.Bin034]|nr:MAG: Nitrogen assimilation regulatory protein [Syntrophorhabdaceae bacterium PtaU1.Bin034]
MKDHGLSGGEINRLYKQVEGKLETIVEKLLVSKVNDNDNILQSVQLMMEKIFIASAMKIANNNITQASRLLGINRNTLSKKLKELGNGNPNPDNGR